MRKEADPRQIDRRKDTLLKRPEVSRRTGLSCASIYRRQALGTFPRSVKLGVSSVAWYESDVGEWIADPMGWRP